MRRSERRIGECVHASAGGPDLPAFAAEAASAE